MAKTSAPKTAPATDAATPAGKQVSAVPADLVKLVKQDLGETLPKLTQKDIKAVAESFVKVLIDQVKAGHNVSLTNHLTFKRVLRGERTHKNPKTGEPLHKPAHYILSCDVKPTLKKVFEALEVTVTAAPAKPAPAEAKPEVETEAAPPAEDAAAAPAEEETAAQ